MESINSYSIAANLGMLFLYT